MSESTHSDAGTARSLLDERSGHFTAPYVFVEHTLPSGGVLRVRPDRAAHRTFVVVAGEVRLRRGRGGPESHPYGRFDGWHAPPGAAYDIVNGTERAAVLVEAGTEVPGPAGTGPDADTLAPADPFDVSSYTVRKPWGHEVWYTQNLLDAPYAVKQIHMDAGHRSSLQSHVRKAETNYVVDGETVVRDGLAAPADLTAVVEEGRLNTTVHGPGSSWTSAPGILHRVEATSDYTSIEVSTPELDDVVRWQDDTARGSGRIASEHAASRP